MSKTFRDVAPRLDDQGYLPIPIKVRDKAPAVDDWPNYRLAPGDINQYAKCGTGILCGAVVGIDIDVRDEELAVRIERIVLERFGSAPRRIGQAPKVLLLYRTDAPFSKITTRGFRLPSDAPEDKSHKVEALAAGQQFVAYGVHPGTGKPYQWNGAGDPLGVPASALPVVNEAQVKALIGEIDELLAEYGAPTGRLRDEDATRAHEPNEQQRGDPAIIRSALKAIPNADLDYDDWVYLGHASKGALGDEGIDAWRELSARSSKHVPEETDRAWRSFKPSRIGAGTIVYLARKHGWQIPAPAGAILIDIKAPLNTARLFVDHRFRVDSLPTLQHWQSQFYRHIGTSYALAETNIIRQRLYEFLDLGRTDAGAAIKPNKSMVDNVQDALRAVTHLDAQNVPVWLDGRRTDPVSELIPCANGIVHVPSRRLLPPTPSLFNLNAAGFAFDANAPAPTVWRGFIESMLDDDCDAIEALQEFFGLALTLETKYQKALLIVGPKRSGKGTIARVLTALVGAANTAAPTLAGLGGQFGLQALIGKQLAIISDARLGGRADIHAVTENLLRITGEDHIGVPRKHLADYTARLPVRFVIMINEVPALADSSGALPSRFIVLRLTRTFYGREDTSLTDKLLSELPGVFLWALEGLERLRKRGAFVQPASGQTMLDQLDELASPIKAFLRERCVLSPGASVECAYLFDQWREWCRLSNREHPGTAQVFGRNLAAAIPGLQTSNLRVGDGRARHYSGIRLRRGGDPE